MPTAGLEPPGGRTCEQVDHSVHLPPNDGVADEQRVSAGEEPACAFGSEPGTAALWLAVLQSSSRPVRIAGVEKAALLHLRRECATRGWARRAGSSASATRLPDVRMEPI